jgi:hypothetical protein
MEERQYAKYPTQHRPVANLDLVNEKIREVIKRVMKIGRAKGILSPKYAEWAQTLSAGDADLAKDILDTSENSYGTAPDLARMQKIVERAARNVVAGRIPRQLAATTLQNWAMLSDKEMSRIPGFQ